MTKVEAIADHRDMWWWITNQIRESREVKDIGELKRQYCEKHGIKIINRCFCCEYSKVEGYKVNCEKCPLRWPSWAFSFMCESGYGLGDGYGLWRLCCEEKDWKKQACLARIIAELPEQTVGGEYLQPGAGAHDNHVDIVNAYTAKRAERLADEGL